MRTEKTSKYLLSTVELTCLMPIKPGFVGTLDTRTYATRLRIAMRMLHALRKAAREVRTIRPLADIVDTVGSIHTFTLAVVNGERQLLLSVCFDGAWEPYVRGVWRDIGPLLDLFMCNCVGFEEHGSRRGFEKFAEWLRMHQVEADLFYASSSLSVTDIRYLSKLERSVRTGESADALAGIRVDDPVEIARDEATRNPEALVEQGLAVLGLLHGLRELHPGTDEDVLLRAARSLLRTLPDQLPAPVEQEHAEPLAWLRQSSMAVPKSERLAPTSEELQGGILTPYRKVTHGCLLMFRVVDRAAASGFLQKIVPFITKQADLPSDGIFRNVAFTYGGLRAFGVPDADLAQLPREFREGMAARAGLLGDVRSNHPNNWRLPEWNCNPPHDRAPRLPLSTIDVIMDLRRTEQWDAGDAWAPGHPLWDDVARWASLAEIHGVRLLSVQPMRNFFAEDKSKRRPHRDHFGVVDGISNPMTSRDPAEPPRNVVDDTVPVGDMLVGHESTRNDPPFEGGRIGTILDNGTFLVIRKLRQDVGALEDVLSSPPDGISKDDLRGRLIGRMADGRPLVAPDGGAHNDFNYANDPAGSMCPFHAHIRRANPRTPSRPPGPGAPAQFPRPSRLREPRIARRGMSYGPQYTEATRDADRGMMFMAYNASIAEQFEVIQGWLAGGNSTGSFSGPSDPLLGIPDGPGSRVFQFIENGNGNVGRVDLGDTPFVVVQWGMYLFVPSMAYLRMMATPQVLRLPGASPAADNALLGHFTSKDDWTAVMEDVTAQHSGVTAAVLGAIRRTAGIMDTPYGVIVARHDLVMQVLTDDTRFSVSEYGRRMDASIGRNYLGLDSTDSRYASESAPNAEIQKITEIEAFKSAREAGRRVLDEAKRAGGTVTLSLEPFVDRVLAILAEIWVGIPDGVHFKQGGRPAPGSSAVHCPFHFLAPSRYIFSSPDPRPPVVAAGQGHGTRVRQAMLGLVADWRQRNPIPGVLAKELFKMIPDDDQLARSLVGVLEGFLPTVYGNFLKTAHLWIGSEELWRLQQEVLSAPNELDAKYDRLQRSVLPALAQAMQTRPVPDMVYRMPTRDVDLDGVHIARGRPVVCSIVSATHELMENGSSDISSVFGGQRAGTHPPHACPGYAMGIGVLLGTFTALLEAGTLRPGPTPYVLLLEGFGEPAPRIGATTGV